MVNIELFAPLTTAVVKIGLVCPSLYLVFLHFSSTNTMILRSMNIVYINYDGVLTVDEELNYTNLSAWFTGNKPSCNTRTWYLVRTTSFFCSSRSKDNSIKHRKHRHPQGETASTAQKTAHKLGESFQHGQAETVDVAASRWYTNIKSFPNMVSLLTGCCSRVLCDCTTGPLLIFDLWLESVGIFRLGRASTTRCEAVSRALPF